MNTYFIQQKIKTVANLGFNFQQDGYVITPYEPEKGIGSEEWLAAKAVLAADYHSASMKFRLELIPVLDALSVLTQCSFTVIAMSYFVYRITENADGSFYLYVAKDAKTVGMFLWEKNQLEDLQKLLNVENKVALHYLRESNNSSTLKTRLAMLVIAGEALAGQITKERKCPKCGHTDKFSSSDRTLLAQMFGKEMFERLYVKDQGSLRHKLFHGSVIPDKDVGEVIAGVYDHMLEYLTKTYGLTTIQKIVNAPRSFTSFEHGGLFLRPSQPKTPDLKEAETKWRDQSVFTFIEEPKGY